MDLPNAAKPATARTVNGPRKNDRLGGAICTRDKPSRAEIQLPKLDSSHVDLDTLERMADWRHSLTCRIRRAQLRFELADCELPELHDLAREARDFTQCCRALKWRSEASA
jgi:hypothetical protein